MNDVSVPAGTHLRVLGYVDAGQWDGSTWFTETRTVAGTRPAPIVLEQPLLVTAYNAETISLRTVGGPGPVTYQWLKNGMNIPGGTAAELRLPNLQPEDAGDYSVVISNAYGSQISSVVQVKVLIRPAFLSYHLENGVLHMSVSARNTERVIIEASSDLRNWAEVKTTNVGGAQVIFSFNDPINANPNRFYRLRQESE